MASSLYSLVSKQMNSQSGKTRLGYTVSQYANVLSSLETSKYIINKIIKNVYRAGHFDTSTGLSAGQAYSTYDDAGKLSIKIQKNTNFSDKSEFQAMCTVNPYMSYCVDYNSKRIHVPQGCPNPPTETNQDMHLGVSLLGSATYPPYKDLQNVSSGKWNEDFVIGVGIDFGTFLKQYLDNFFGSDAIGASNDQLLVIAKNKQMFVEILIPKDGIRKEVLGSDSESDTYSGNFYVIHCPVTCNPSFSANFYKIWLPVPLFLINDFSSLATVHVKTGNDFKKVGGGEVTFPFANNKYNHTTGKIKGFNWESYKNVEQLKNEENGILQSKFNLGNSDEENNICFIRVFFDKSAQESLKLNIQDTKLKDQLFKSKYSANSFITRDVVYDNAAIGGVGWYGQLGTQVGLPGSHIERAFLVVIDQQSGGDWGMWKHCMVRQGRKRVPDTQGISAGAMQFTQVSGGILRYRNIYVQLQKASPNEAPAMSDGMYNDIKTYSGLNESSKLEKYALQFANQSKTEIGRTAQLKLWEGNKEGGKSKKEYTIQAYKNLNCNSAAEFCALLGMMNHLPGYFSGILKRPHYKKMITDETDAVRRAKLIQAIHWKEYGNSKYGKEKPPSVWDTQHLTIQDFINQPLYENDKSKEDKMMHGTHRDRCRRVMKFFTNNKDLVGAEKYTH